VAAKDNTIGLLVLVILAGAGAGTAANHGVGVHGPAKAPTKHTSTVCTKYFKGGC
jgi:hypothetical protein